MFFSLHKLFVFSIPELNYTKKDLNVAQSKNRQYIGLLARMVTNAIFLSHALRKNISIRIFIQKIIPHIIQIQSETIRYLGPEERSLASLLLKAENVFEEKITNGFITKNSSSWIEPNPGIFVRATDDPWINIEDFLEPPITIVKVLNQTSAPNSSVEKAKNKQYSLKEFEQELLTIAKSFPSLIFPLDLLFLDNTKEKRNNDELKIIAENSYEKHYFQLQREMAPAKLVTIINLILDKLEKKE